MASTSDILLDINEAWENFCDGDYETLAVPSSHGNYTDIENDKTTPSCSPIYISTKTKISYLSHSVNLADTFWKIPLTPYHIPRCGIIKKQMKFISCSQDELTAMQTNIPSDIYTDQYLINKIENPVGRIKFKDVRKVSIGLCKKDITSYRCKKKGAFYNCFALILRIKHDGKFKEIHVKVFNTGKLEIPGIQTDDVLVKTLDLLTSTIGPIVMPDSVLTWDKEKSETVLINSNFTCNYYVNREKLFELLKYKYNINSAYDPCSYPGIQCEFYYDNDATVQDGRQPTVKDASRYIKMSFMIFRTGSVLIVGKCREEVLVCIYDYIRHLLENEYSAIGGPVVEDNDKYNALTKKKIRKKIVLSV